MIVRLVFSLLLAWQMQAADSPQEQAAVIDRAWQALPATPLLPSDSASSEVVRSIFNVPPAFSVPLKYVSGHFLIRADVDRRAVALILDSGCTDVIFEHSVARWLALDGTPALDRTYHGSSWSVQRECKAAGQLLGEVRLYFTQGTFDLNPALRILPHLPGLFGFEQLRGFGAVLDCASGSLWFSPRAPTLLGQRFTAHPGKQDYREVTLIHRGESCRWFVRVEINGVAGYMLLDTGVPRTTILRPVAEKVGIAWKPTSIGIGGDLRGSTWPTYETTAVEFTIEGLPVPSDCLTIGEFPRVQEEVLRQLGRLEWGVGFGLLGNDTLIQMQAIVDFAGQRMFLRKNN